MFSKQNYNQIITGLFRRFQRTFPFLKIIVIILPFFLILFYSYSLWRAYRYNITYTIDFADQNFRNYNQPLYINENLQEMKFGSSIEDKDYKYHEIIGAPLNFVFQPQEFLLNKDLVFSAIIKDHDDWQIKMLCEKCHNNSNHIFSWQPFYYGYLQNYQLADTIDGTNIYTLNSTNLTSSTSVNEWLKSNLSLGSSLEIQNQLYPLSAIVNPQIDYLAGQSTVIDKTLRGPHQFYLYLGENLDLEVIKTDLNNYLGKDDITVSLSDLDYHVIWQSTIEDDGISVVSEEKNSKSVNKSFHTAVNQPGVYLLSFNDNQDGKSDWFIKYIKVNTNKIVFTGQTYLLDKAELYTQISAEKNLKAVTWHTNGSQKINFSNSNFSQDLEITAQDLGNPKTITLPPGQYHVMVNGDQYLSGANFALNPENYFEPFIYDLTKLSNPSAVISDYSFSKESDSSWVKVSKRFSARDLKYLNNTNQITFQLTNDQLRNNYTQVKSLISKSIFPRTEFADFELWGKKDLVSYNFQSENLTNWLLGVIPPSSSLQDDGQLSLDQYSFLNNQQPSNFSAADNDIDLLLRGPHQFYVYLSDSLISKIDVQELNLLKGEDRISFSLSDQNDNVICEDSFSDDGNKDDNKIASQNSYDFNCYNLNPGTYVLQINGLPDGNNDVTNDFVLNKIRINTNKIVVKDQIQPTGPIQLFTNYNSNLETSWTFWDAGRDQTITLKGDLEHKIKLMPEDIGKSVDAVLPKGQLSISIPKGDLTIHNGIFALSPDNWFEPVNIYLIKSDDADFVLLKNNNPDSAYIRQISVSVIPHN